MNRRHFLAMLSSLPFAEGIGQTAMAQTSSLPPETVTHVARVLTGRANLPEEIVALAQACQTELDPGFEQRLQSLVATLGEATPEQREQIIAALSDSDAKTAVELISPLYLGYTGSPSPVKAVDNAKFVTFINALMYEPTADNTIRPSYARGGPNYWIETPNGVMAPSMVDNILQWGSKGPKAAPSYAAPDPRYLALCQGHGKTLAEAEAWLASNPPTTQSGDKP